MEFRPCIDIHNGKVKQIVGASLVDEGNQATANFVSTKDAADYAALYRNDGLHGGHIILLNKPDSKYYEQTKAQAIGALQAWPGHLQIGGGIQADNAADFISAGASAVIVTSYVFRDGKINYDHLQALCDAVGREHVVLDLSCKRKGDNYYIVTDRWQKFTDVVLSQETLQNFETYAAEFLVHAADVEGQRAGIDETVVSLLGTYEGIPVTYAGGIRDFSDLETLYTLGHGRVNFTIGSALDLFGGNLPYADVLAEQKKYQ